MSIDLIVDGEETNPFECLRVAKSMHNNKEYANALEMYNSAITVKPDLIQAYAYLGMLHVDMGHIELAMQRYYTAIDLGLCIPRIIKLMSDKLLDVDKVKEAYAFLEHAYSKTRDKDVGYVKCLVENRLKQSVRKPRAMLKIIK